VAEAVAGRAEVWVDGGITRGLDVIVAKALGASGVLIGRPFYWALAAAGRDGVRRAAALVHRELELALRLLGRASIAEVDRAVLA
jgi:isopentenyl diphosphate isomerase/L-lactate dehydrogenase-like FMN-dependent dehydrogenase